MMYYGKPSPFTQWWDKNITQMAVSPDIRELLARAFEGGRESIKLETLSDGEIEQIWKEFDEKDADNWFIEIARAIEAKVRGEK